MASSSIYTKFTGSTELTDESAISASPQPPSRKKKEDSILADMEVLVTETAKRADPATASMFKEKDRKVSTGTLNRLILVAQALESEVDSRRQTDVSGGKITFSIRMANMILLVLINGLVFTGFGKYQEHTNAGYKDLLLTADKWSFDINHHDFPATFSRIQLNGQYLAAAITVFLLLSTVCLQLIHICNTPSSRLTSMCYSFGAVPFSLFVFGLEMHYSTCPWVDEYYIEYSVMEMNAQCAINGWALAGIFSLLSCGLFVSEGLITAFFRSENQERKETIL